MEGGKSYLREAGRPMVEVGKAVADMFLYTM
jgi:hypothetical protein